MVALGSALRHPPPRVQEKAPIRVVILKGSWPVPSESPACLKLLTWLRMAGLPYEATELRGPPKSKTGKAPYIIRPDGTVLDDSSVIIDALTAEHGIDLDAKRTESQRALMVLAQRTVESHLYFAGLLARWRDAWPATKAAYFGTIPQPLRLVLPSFLRRQALRQAHGHGLGRRPPEHVDAEVRADLQALDHLRGDDDFYFGSPGVTDAIVYGTLENARACPVESTARAVVEGSDRWMRYLDRIKARYWS